jgi:hypothetical protein
VPGRMPLVINSLELGRRSLGEVDFYQKQPTRVRRTRVPRVRRQLSSPDTIPIQQNSAVTAIGTMYVSCDRPRAPSFPRSEP